MSMKTLYACLLISSVSCGFTTQASENDFDKVCEYFQALAKLDHINSMTKLTRNDFIIKHINKNLKPTSDARVAWEAIGSADASIRYSLYKSSAESVIKRKWQCNAMKKLAPITGEF